MTSPQYYTPKNPSIVDAIQANKRIVDAILRNNPLQDAIVSRGLMHWIGNYVFGGGPDKIHFMQVGEIHPTDPNLGGIPQRGFSLVRDDSRGGVSAIAMLDPNPGGGGGLRQVVRVTSGDQAPLMYESRDGGLEFPAANISWCPLGTNLALWPSTDTGNEDVLWEGRLSVQGNRLLGYIYGASTAATTGEVWVRVSTGSGDIDSPKLTLPANSSTFHNIDLDISSERGNPDLWISIIGKRLTGTGTIHAAPGRLHNRTP